jgi:hypothetical protein
MKNQHNMKTSIKKFLQFNGKDILFLAIDGQYWVALKPICEALGVNWSRQLRTLKSHKILGQLWSIQTMVGSNNGLNKMVALPEKYVYGWLFGIRSNSDACLEYQFKCFEILFEYFHGAIGIRSTTLLQKAQDEFELNQLVAELKQQETFRRYQNLKGSILRSGKALKELDKKFVDTQLRIFNQ